LLLTAKNKKAGISWLKIYLLVVKISLLPL